jgi:hypothetical protein
LKVLPDNWRMRELLALFNLGGGELILLLAVIVPSIFWLWMLVDCAQRETKGKAVWIIVLALTSCIGAAVYYVVRKLPRDAEARVLAAMQKQAPTPPTGSTTT